MTGRGKFFLTLLILGVVGFGVWRWLPQLAPGIAGTAPGSAGAAPGGAPSGAAPADTSPSSRAAKPPLDAPEIVEPQSEAPRLAPPGVYQPTGDVYDVEISGYAGYSGLVAANGGLEPNANSVFARKHGFRLKIFVSEEEGDTWSVITAGKLAATATTVDVVAAYGKQFDVLIPVLIGYSRGADGIVVRSDVTDVNSLRGRTLAAVQFSESEFFLRYLAQEAGLPVNMLRDLSAKPDPESVNLVFCDKIPQVPELFIRHVEADHHALSGFVGWAPDTTDAVEAADGEAHLLTTNVNLLIIADVLVVNRGLAQQRPEFVAGLVDGLLEGNRMVRDNPEAQLDVIGKAFKWDRETSREQLKQIHLANLPENDAFFSGAITSAGSFEGIYQSALYAYGSSLIRNPVDAMRFFDPEPLKKATASGAFKDQVVAIAPIRAKGAVALENPLLSKNVRFLFAPESADLDEADPQNMKYLESVRSMLQVSPGSTLILRGHVDNVRVEDIRRQGGEALLRKAALQAVELSKRRAGEIKRILVDTFGADPARLEVVGLGWNEPLGGDSEQNRRVEVQWFTLE
jgi:NitT/TauT family transport system substrate-binding protein